VIIKTFKGETETEVLLKVREELGPNAVVSSVKAIKAKGLGRLFKKTTYEATASLDENPPEVNLPRKESMKNIFKNNPNIIFEEDEKPAEDHNPFADRESLELRINNLASMLEKQIGEGGAAKNPAEPSADGAVKDTADDKNVSCIRLIYNQLLENEVDEKYINMIVSEIEPTLKKDAPVENILSAIYQKIVLKLGKTEVLDINRGKVKYVFLVGPTGVGKTTTIAKLASKLKLDKKLNVALITADTYRIAAVKQLEVYANILNIPLKVINNEAEMEEAKEDLSAFDIVLIDTAGRSHKDRRQCDDIERLINTIPEEDREVFLVLSVTTKYRDLEAITEAYSEISDYRLIFTKLDETMYLGNIFNIKLLTGAPLSYATFGQGVPNDISRIDAQTIAKQLLGGGD
jgi:flagellar biosynthesis protein FlhF